MALSAKTGNNYDIIIAGGGPAGLSVGSEMAKRGYRVLLLEKGVAGQTKRSWFVPPFVLDPITKNFAYGGVTRFLAATYTGAKTQWKAKLFPSYPYIDEKKILPYWVDTLKRFKGTIMNNTSYVRHTITGNQVHVQTTAGQFNADLIIDAMGYESPIAANSPAMKDAGYYWWSVYGAIVDMDLSGGLQLGDYMMWETFRDTNADPNESLKNGRPVFEYEVLRPSPRDPKKFEVFALLLFLRTERVAKEAMQPFFERMLRKEDATAPFHNSVFVEEKYGWYPSGGVSQRKAMTRVALIGDAGCWTTPCGWGMTFILQNYMRYADKLDETMKAGRFDAVALQAIPAFRVEEQFQIVFDRLVIHFLAEAPAAMLDKFINFFNIIDPILCEKMFTLTMEKKDFETAIKLFLNNFTFKELASILSPDDYRLIVQVIETAVKDIALDEAHEWLDKIAGKPVKPNNGGFEFN